jgi:hypothetical protein
MRRLEDSCDDVSLDVTREPTMSSRPGKLAEPGDDVEMNPDPAAVRARVTATVAMDPRTTGRLRRKTMSTSRPKPRAKMAPRVRESTQARPARIPRATYPTAAGLRHPERMTTRSSIQVAKTAIAAIRYPKTSAFEIPPDALTYPWNAADVPAMRRLALPATPE